MLAQFFKIAHRAIVCIRVFIKVNAYTCMRIYIFTVFLKKIIVHCYWMVELGLVID
jgi:hypothetical protein